MKLTVQLFARARDLAGAESVQINVPETARADDVRTALAERFPELRPLIPTLLIAVGTEYADDETPITLESEVACFPPVSGG